MIHFFGCSQTYGHCLPDCYVQPPKPKGIWDVDTADKPSEQCFAAIVGRELGVNIKNHAWPGASNKYMWYKMINKQYDADDTVVCVWTLIDRTYVIRKDDAFHLGVWDSPCKRNQAFRRYVAQNDSNENLELDAFHLIDHAHRIVAPKVKKILHYKMNPSLDNPPDWFSLKFVNSLCYMVPLGHDLALDGMHYGVESHKTIAKQMIQDLTIVPN
jgi:hypothetical protein